MPEPMMPPTTTVIASNGPSTRGSVCIGRLAISPAPADKLCGEETGLSKGLADIAPHGTNSPNRRQLGSRGICRHSLSPRDDPSRRERHAAGDAEPAHEAGLEDNRSVYDHKQEEAVPSQRQPARTRRAPRRRRPPPNHVGDPGERESVIEIQPRAGVPTEHFRRSPRRLGMGLAMAPVVIKLKRA